MLLSRLSLVLVVVVTAVVSAEEPVEPKPEAGEDLQELIRQLDADDFNDRQAASEALAKRGKGAVPALEEAVRGESLEAATRSFELLRRIYEKGDAESKSAARGALERISQGRDAAARQAKQILEPPVQQQPNAALPGRIRIPAAAGVVVRRTVKTSINNGVKTIDVDDNGKKFKLTEDPTKGIEGEITETKDGKEQTEKFSAKDADELKKNHPEAHKLYEQYARGAGGGIRVEIGGGFGGRLAPPAPTKEGVEASIKRYEDQIKQVKDDPGLPPEFRAKRLEALERLKKRYEETLKELDKKDGP